MGVIAMHQAPVHQWLPEAAAAHRSWVYFMGLGCAAAIGFGIAFPIAPRTAIEVLVLIPLAFAAPVAALAVLIAVTSLVPFAVQDALSVVGGRDQPGLLFVDALLMLGLLRVGWLVVRRRLEFDFPLLGGIAGALICCTALAWGVSRGADLSEAGHEARHVVMGVGTFILAWPLVAERSARKRLVWVLIALGLALGLWGLAQWVFSVDYATSGDIGVRPGVDRVAGGRGMLQGGMFGYPIAVTLAWAALVSGKVRKPQLQGLLGAIVVLNAVCLVLTYERTIWAVTMLSCCLVVVLYGASAVRPAFKWAGLGLAALMCLAAVAPGEATTALQRLMSVSQISTDNSLSYRLIESQSAITQIAVRPVTGSGLGATLTWESHGVFHTLTTPFIHNGDLWLAWKFGLPVAALVLLVMVFAVIRRSPRGDSWQWRAVRIGSRAAMFGLLLVPVTFPIFNLLGVTPLVGFLLAVCFSRATSEQLMPDQCSQ
jgi:hypothetical protein